MAHMFDIILLQALYGASVPINKSLLLYAQPFFAVGLRLSVVGFILTFYAIIYKRHKALPTRSTIFYYAQISVCGIYAKYMLRNWSLQHLSVTKMACIFSITPFIAAIVSFFMLAERVSRKQILGMFLGCLSIAPLLAYAPPQEVPLRESLHMMALVPELVLVLAIIAHCYGMIITKIVLNDHQQPVILVNGLSMLCGGMLCLVSAWYYEGLFPVNQVAPFALGTVSLIVLSNVVCRSWYLYLLKRYSVTFLSCTDFLSPIFATLYGYLVCGETLTYHYIGSFLLLGMGLFIFYRDELVKSYALHT